ncbi:transglutaminase-like cysteine peptidase [Mesorhizobium sp. LHD-90]|uniref:transglutaminase-like cysteine peptidase n=1 Tax=Mesorhizobium sp. LHD-90 TaxID=3071414 RepID=UPI0027E1417F|nr:transglutaminase-like cysteine peptidase [Mesorhizobium sp. LHD-90]MDQ6434222.1 transglutaminase-like cysteine peptidase [Mesorhizobium sp. LHD-90]
MQSSPRARLTAMRIGMLVAAAIGTLTAGQAVASGPMITGGLTSQPIGHYEFCKATPSECSIRLRDRGPERMSGALWSLLVGINTEVNAAVKPLNDLDIYGKDEVWAYPDGGVGDCEDYVLEKRRQLQERGVSLSNLLMTVVRKPDGEGHAVLTVRTDKGDFVLDNLTNSVRDWNQTGYRFLKRQASNHTGRWVTIREGSAPLVGSVQ